MHQTCPKNLASAEKAPLEVTNALIKELVRGHTAGPFKKPPFATTHCSPIGVVPKSDGAHRLILDLSSPQGISVNDGISHDDFSVQYSKFDHAAELVFNLGPASWMSKIDVQHAFRILPVRQQDWPLLCYKWMGYYLVDTRLPFGGRSCPYIFNTFADILTWVLISVYCIPFILHYLDDWLIVDKTFSRCSEHMQTMMSACSELGIPLSSNKIVGPSQTITYLGIEIDSKERIMRLPPDKLETLTTILGEWKQKRKCRKRELLSLIGKLAFAAKVVKPGRIFLRRLIALSTRVNNLNHFIYINEETRKDILWWHDFIGIWNGKSLLQSPPVTSSALKLFTDASGALGFGAVFNNAWFSSEWPPNLQGKDINYKELFSLVAAVFTWGVELSNKQVIMHTDNLSITRIWMSGTTSREDLMQLVRALFFFGAKMNINIMVQHVLGHSNALADSLSRFDLQRFRRLHPHADIGPTPINPEVWNL